MHRLKCKKQGDSMVYQWHKYNTETYQLEEDMEYNEPIVLYGKEYTPVNGSFVIPLDIMQDIPTTIGEMNCELNDIRKDLRLLFKLVASEKGWLGQ